MGTKNGVCWYGTSMILLIFFFISISCIFFSLIRLDDAYIRLCKSFNAIKFVGLQLYSISHIVHVHKISLQLHRALSRPEPPQDLKKMTRTSEHLQVFFDEGIVFITFLQIFATGLTTGTPLLRLLRPPDRASERVCNQPKPNLCGL